jgi:magnesium-transporting ATPase (P-type)
MVGDPIDMAMFAFSGFEFRLMSDMAIKFEVYNNLSKSIQVLKYFEFESVYQRMGVLAKHNSG